MSQIPTKMEKNKVSDHIFKGKTLVYILFWVDGFFILIGNAPIRINLGRDNLINWLSDKGPRLKQYNKSLKLPSHVMKKPVIPAGITEERDKGKKVKRVKTGRREKILNFPFGILETMK